MAFWPDHPWFLVLGSVLVCKWDELLKHSALVAVWVIKAACSLLSAKCGPLGWS